MEYFMHLPSPDSGHRTIIVMGHTGCGACKGAVAKDPHDHNLLPALMEPLAPARELARFRLSQVGVEIPPFGEIKSDPIRLGQIGDAVAIANVDLQIALLKEVGWVKKAIEEGKLSVIGAMYHLDGDVAGKIDWYFDSPLADRRPPNLDLRGFMDQIFYPEKAEAAANELKKLVEYQHLEALERMFECPTGKLAKKSTKASKKSR
jgi:hypothetical protein